VELDLVNSQDNFRWYTSDLF